jgi:hypothetical protein
MKPPVSVSRSAHSKGSEPRQRRHDGRRLGWLAALAIAPLLIAGARATETLIGGVGSFHEATNWSGGAVPGTFTPIAVTNGARCS